MVLGYQSVRANVCRMPGFMLTPVKLYSLLLCVVQISGTSRQSDWDEPSDSLHPVQVPSAAGDEVQDMQVRGAQQEAGRAGAVGGLSAIHARAWLATGVQQLVYVAKLMSGYCTGMRRECTGVL